MRWKWTMHSEWFKPRNEEEKVIYWERVGSLVGYGDVTRTVHDVAMKDVWSYRNEEAWKAMEEQMELEI